MKFYFYFPDSPIIPKKKKKNVVKNRRTIKESISEETFQRFSKLLKYSSSNNRSDKSPSNNPPFISSWGFNTLHARNRTRTVARPVSIYPTDEVLPSFFRLPKKKKREREKKG